MLERIPSIVRSAVVPRALLLANHVVAAEPAALARLRPMAGRRIDLRLADLPAPLAWGPQGVFDLSVRITPAGLLEWTEVTEGPGDLIVTLDGSNPLVTGLKVASGERPPVHIEGDAALAAEVNWLLEHLRWDLEEDLGRIVGPSVAHEVAKVGRLIKAAFARVAGAAAGLASRRGAEAPGGPSGEAGPQGPMPR